jgi:hypothetical protein
LFERANVKNPSKQPAGFFKNTMKKQLAGMYEPSDGKTGQKPKSLFMEPSG